MTFDEWWNSADADSYRAHMDGLHGEDVRRVWDAAMAIEQKRYAELLAAYHEACADAAIAARDNDPENDPPACEASDWTPPTDYDGDGSVAAMAAKVSAPQWMPIESAPKDGTDIDVWCPSATPGDGGGYRVANAWWGAHSNSWRSVDDHGIGWAHQPTHWMPLPPPPKLP